MGEKNSLRKERQHITAESRAMTSKLKSITVVALATVIGICFGAAAVTVWRRPPPTPAVPVAKSTLVAPMACATGSIRPIETHRPTHIRPHREPAAAIPPRQELPRVDSVLATPNYGQTPQGADLDSVSPQNERLLHGMKIIVDDRGLRTTGTGTTGTATGAAAGGAQQPGP